MHKPPAGGAGGCLAKSQSEWCENHHLPDTIEPADASTSPPSPNTEQVVDVSAVAASRLLHATTFPIRLNETWQVAYDDLQWKLQHRRGDRWHDRSFCCTQAALIRNVREHCGEVDPHELNVLSQLPTWHPDRQVQP
jgi:hypothetical protein